MKTLTANTLYARYPQLSGLMERCRKPERDAQILSLALIAGVRNDEIANQVGVSRSVVAHVVHSARRYLAQHDVSVDEHPALPLEARDAWHQPSDTGTSSEAQPLELSTHAPQGEAAPQTIASNGEHIENMLFELAAGQSTLDPASSRSLADHLIMCEHCQVALGVAIGVITLDANASEKRHTKGRSLLIRLGALLQRTRVRSQLSAYADIQIASGQLAAQQSYPEVTAHLRTCIFCRSAVENWILQRSTSDDANSEFERHVGGAQDMNNT